MAKTQHNCKCKHCKELGCSCDSPSCCENGVSCHPISKFMTKDEHVSCLINSNNIQLKEKDSEILTMKLKILELHGQVLDFQKKELKQVEKDLRANLAFLNTEQQVLGKVRSSNMKRIINKYKIPGDSFAYDPETGEIKEGVSLNEK